jgi:hypothetical protein
VGADYKFIVTVILLLCTNKQGGNPLHNTFISLTYASLAALSRHVPSIGEGKVVKMTAVSRLWRVMSSLRIRCWARQGRSLKESGMAAWLGKPDAGPVPPVDGAG